jgi:cytochrome c-type biogenesis protein CcmH
VILFLIIAVVLVGIGTTLLILPFFRTIKQDSNSIETPQSQTSLSILQENLSQLKVEHQMGQLTDEDFAKQQEELEKRTLDEVISDPQQNIAVVNNSVKKLPIFLAIFIPLAVVGMYFITGNPSAIDPPIDPQEQQILQMAKQLEDRLKTEPNNAQGWVFLARTYGALNRLTDAKNAFYKALTLDPKNSDTLADLADLVAYENKSMNGQALDLIDQSLAANPKNPKALALKGTAAFEKGDYASAIKNWELAIPNLGPNEAAFAQGLNASIAEAKNLLKPNQATAINPALTISGKVMIAPGLQSRISPTDIVFIYAKAIEGPKLPLAIIKSTAGQLPTSFVLSDEQSMSPQFKLSQFKEVSLTARVSKSGNAIPEKGDLIGFIPKLKIGEKNIQLVIQDVQP